MTFAPHLDLSKMDIPQVIYYLEKFGWTKIQTDNEKIFLFGGFEDDDGNEIVIPIPASMKYADSGILLLDAISFISRITGRTVQDTVEEILSPSRDVIKLRLLFQASEGDLPSLEDTVTVLQEVKTILAYSAHIERAAQIEPRFETPKFLAKYGAYGTSYLKKCRFGHTFKGSFGLVIESYLGDTSKGVLPIMEPLLPLPVERKVVQRFVNGLQAAQQAEQKKSVDILLNSYQSGLNGNMCQSLSELFLNTPLSSVDCNVLWSPTWTPDDSFFSTATVSRNSVRYLQSASELLKEKVEQRNITIKGEIVRQELAEPGEEQESITSPIGRRVVIQTKIDGKPRRVIAYLDDLMHKQACDAYKERREIELSGTLDVLSATVIHLRLVHDLLIGDPITG